MATFVYYNPKTNTIEKRNLAQQTATHVPYLLNFQPQDLDYAMKSTNILRSNPPQFESPERSYYEKENLYSRDRQKDEFETIKKSYKPQEESDIIKRVPLNDSNSIGKEYLLMEDLNEDDLEQTPQYYQAPKRQSKTMSHRVQTFEPEKMAMKKTVPPQQHTYAEEVAKGDFKLVKPEDLILKYKPEDYSINERILNAKYVSAEQERTRKFILDRIGSDIKAMETKASGLEKDLQMTEEETKDLELRTQKIWQEIERKRFELKANQVLNRIDKAIEIEPEADQEERLNNFFTENRALFDEVDKVLEGEGFMEENEEDMLYAIEDSRNAGKSKGSGYGRSTSSGIRSSKPKSSGYGAVSKQNRKGLDKELGRRNMVKTVSEEKTRNATRVNMNAKTGIAAKRREIIVKNPKKVEEALQKAKEIADLY